MSNSAKIVSELINPFIQAAANVFTTMLELKIGAARPFLKEKGNPMADISCTIGITGEVNGVVGFVFNKETACLITKHFLQEEHSEIDDVVADAIGEMSNMITGNVKTTLGNAGGSRFNFALPSIMVKEDHTITYPKTAPCMVVPLTIMGTNCGLYIEICLQNS